MSYIYGHMRPDILKLFYIGKGSGNRCHVTRGRNKYWKAIANKYGFKVVILEDGLTDDEAYQKEIDWISWVKEEGAQLTNMTEGGDKPPVHRGKKSPLWNHGFKGEKSPNWANFDRDAAVADYLNGMSASDCAKKYNVSKPSIFNELKRRGIDYRNPNKWNGYTPPAKTGKDNKKSVGVLHLESGIYFDTLSEAAMAFNMKRTTLTEGIRLGRNKDFITIKI